MRIDRSEAFVSAIIPCLDEEAAIGGLVAHLIQIGLDEVIVVDGGSRDHTVAVAKAAGARIVVEPRRGYGRACAAGVAAVGAECQIVAFIDGDGSDDPAFAPAIIGPVLRGEVDFCMGSRVRGQSEPGSLTPQQIVAGRLAGLLLWATYGVRFTDMSPFRAIRRDCLAALGMAETTYGWNLEMQMRVCARRLRLREVAVDCRRRVGGVSKVSGNFRATLPAAWSLARTFVRLAASLRGAPVN